MTDAETTMTQPTKHICQWVTNSHNHVFVQLKAAKLCAQHRTNNIGI